MKRSCKQTLLFLLFFSFFTSNIIIAQSGYLKDKFYIGYYNWGYWHLYRNYTDFLDLNINMMQYYGYHMDYDNHQTADLDGGFKNLIGSYSGHIGEILGEWGSSMQTRALYMEREKILRGAYGQKSCYETEMVNPQSQHPGYGYTNRQGNVYTENWQGETVSGINTGPPDNPTNGHWLISGLYENEEQSDRVDTFTAYDPNRTWPGSYYYSDVKTPGYRWFVLPRMRVCTTDVNGTSKPVCRIVAIAYNNDTVMRQVIYTDNFKDIFGNYNGEYRETFYQGQVLIDLSVRGDSLNRGNPRMLGHDQQIPLEGNNVDYRIYWYGQVDVWLDKVTLEDEWAFYLFHPLLEPTPKVYDFVTKIHEEDTSTSIGRHANFGYFYMDEYIYNSIPCVAEVNRLIKLDNPNSGLVAVDLPQGLCDSYGLKNPPSTYYDALEYARNTGAIFNPVVGVNTNNKTH